MLPYQFRYAGIVLFLAGIIMTIAYLFYDFRLLMPVFAIFSSFLETKIFSVISTNIADELLMICLLTGAFFIMFSKEKKDRKVYRAIRYKALMRSVFLNSVLLGFSILFIYGNGFLFILIFNVISVQVFYLFFYHLMKKRIGGPDRKTLPV